MKPHQNYKADGFEINPLLEKLRDYPQAKKSQNSYFKSFDGTNIFYREWVPHNRINKIVVVAHGMGGNGEFFVLLADRLVEHEIMVIAPDYRNHGLSDGKKGDLKNFKLLLKDLYYFLKFIKDKYPETPVFLFGESMGGTVSINFAKEYYNNFSSLSGLILFAPGVKIDFSKKFWVLISLIFIPLTLFRLLFPSKTIISLKSNEEEDNKNPIHQEYDKTDELHIKKFSVRYILQLFKYMRKTRKVAKNITIPVIIFQGEEDKGISPEGVRDFFNQLSLEDKQLIWVKDGYHTLFIDPSFQDKWNTLIDWLRNH